MFFYGVLDVFCKPEGPPLPPPNDRGVAVTFGGPAPVPPPGLPIDENIIVLILISLIFGIYIIYNHKLKTKTPV